MLTYLQREGVPIALATSSVESRARMILDSNGILSLFDHLVFAKDVKRSKPYPDIFLKACSDLNVLPENCLVLEDSEAGIAAAYRAGIPVICIPDLKIYQGKVCFALHLLQKLNGQIVTVYHCYPRSF